MECSATGLIQATRLEGGNQSSPLPDSHRHREWHVSQHRDVDASFSSACTLQGQSQAHRHHLRASATERASVLLPQHHIWIHCQCRYWHGESQACSLTFCDCAIWLREIHSGKQGDAYCIINSRNPFYNSLGHA